MGLEASQSFEVPEGNLNKLIGSWPSTFAVTQDTTLGMRCGAGGSARHEVADVCCVCTGVSAGVSECVTVSLLGLHTHRGGSTTSWRREGKWPRERPLEQESSWSQRPFICAQNHFVFLTRNNTQSNGFQLPLLLFLTAGQGEEGAPVRSLPCLGPQIQAVLRACSAPQCHVCA